MFTAGAATNAAGGAVMVTSSRSTATSSGDVAVATASAGAVGKSGEMLLTTRDGVGCSLVL
jgi:hypothetical protein